MIGDDPNNSIFELIIKCCPAKISSIKEVLETETLQAFNTWMTIMEIMGRAPELDMSKLRGKQVDFTSDKDHLDRNYINYEGNKVDHRREVGL